MVSMPTLREMNIRVFQGKANPHVLFQPRFEPWFVLHQEKGTLPELFRGKDVYEAYRALGVSMRYLHEVAGAPGPVGIRHPAPMKLKTESVANGFLQIIDTPHGELVTRCGVTDHGTRILDFPVKTHQNLSALEWYFRNTEYYFNSEGFLRGAEAMGDLGEPQFYVARSPYQALALDWMRYEDLVCLFYEAPERLDAVARAVDDSYDPLYAGLAQDAAVRLINFGENVDGRLLSPAIFERYHMPFYEKRAKQLRDADIFTTIHLDGSLRLLLPYLDKLPMDGLEALTPKPQGDVTLEELRAHVGDKILLDGIPAVYFLDEFPLEVLQACVERIVELFGARLVLGVSDEVPMGAGPNALERLVWVRDYCMSQAP